MSPDYAPLRPVRRCTSPSYTRKPRKCTLTAPPDPKSQRMTVVKVFLHNGDQKMRLDDGSERSIVLLQVVQQLNLFCGPETPPADSAPMCGVAQWHIEVKALVDDLASERAYGSVTYLCTVDEDGHIHTSFVLAISKVPPRRNI